MFNEKISLLVVTFFSLCLMGLVYYSQKKLFAHILMLEKRVQYLENSPRRIGYQAWDRTLTLVDDLAKRLCVLESGGKAGQQKKNKMEVLQEKR